MHICVNMCHVYVYTYVYTHYRYVYTHIYHGFIHSHYWPGFESLLKIWNIVLYATILNSHLNSSLPSTHLTKITLFLRTFLTYTVVLKLRGWSFCIHCEPSPHMICLLISFILVKCKLLCKYLTTNICKINAFIK